MSLVRYYRELDVYQNAMNLAMKVFELTTWLRLGASAVTKPRLSPS